jgi:hypothetical protein
MKRAGQRMLQIMPVGTMIAFALSVAGIAGPTFVDGHESIKEQGDLLGAINRIASGDDRDLTPIDIERDFDASMSLTKTTSSGDKIYISEESFLGFSIRYFVSIGQYSNLELSPDPNYDADGSRSTKCTRNIDVSMSIKGPTWSYFGQHSSGQMDTPSPYKAVYEKYISNERRPRELDVYYNLPSNHTLGGSYCIRRIVYQVNPENMKQR